MSVGSISSASVAPVNPEASEVQKAGPDHDGDADDRGAKAVQAPPAPTVNVRGQKIGQVISTAV
jgi:hypothetical protein